MPHPAAETDWQTEYSELILAVRVVDDLPQALEHIRRYGSRHTDAICTTNGATAETFLRGVDSAGVYLNCSTRFADGFRYGFGAEVGISTQTLPPRGPVGLEGLVTSTPAGSAASLTAICRCERGAPGGSGGGAGPAALGPRGCVGARTAHGPVV
ncbi:MAG: hypothetical protein RLZZ516_1201 [Cyanobacteriota bacterium]